MVIKMAEKIDESKIIALLLPKIQATISAAVDGKLATEIMSLKDAMSHELWDKTAAEIGKTMKLPESIIKQLTTIDDIVNANKELVDSSILKMVSDIEAFKDRLKGVDLNATITMSYRELMKVRIKAGVSWGTVLFFLG